MSEDLAEEQLQDQLDLDVVKKRSVSGVVTITLRTFFLQILTFAATFLLTVFLDPDQYGVFFVVSAVVNFLVYFSDIGLAAALIQKKDQLTSDDLATTFTIQQALVFILVAGSLAFSGLVSRFYQLSPAGLWLFRALIIGFFLSSLKTIPSIKLERSLKFSQLIIPQIIENVLFYGLAVYLAWKGWGVTSFTWAVLIRSLAGLIAIYILSPWKPKLQLKKIVARKLLSFGIPFQLNSLLALVKDDLLTAFLGKVLTLTQVGYIGWAQRWALFPLRMFMDSINKVTFPTYSRLQEKKELLKKAIEKSLFFIAIIIFPLTIGLVATAPAFVRLLPRYQKWQPALLALGLFAINSLFSSVSTTLTNTLAATGHIKTNLKLMIFWSSLTWILTPILIFKIGFNGAALASALVALTSVITIFLVKKIIDIKVISQIGPAFSAAVMMGGVAYFLSSKSPSLNLVFFSVLGSGILYGLLILVFCQAKLNRELKTILQLIKVGGHG
jgi:O-antigen/teichoic acid export membrane protein